MRKCHAELCTETRFQTTSMSRLAFDKDACYRLSCFFLDFEEHHRGNKKWNSVDPLVIAGGLRLRRCPGPSFTLDWQQHKKEQDWRSIGVNKILLGSTPSKKIQSQWKQGERLEEVDSFAYPGSVIDKQGGTDIKVDEAARIGKAREALNMLKNISPLWIWDVEGDKRGTPEEPDFHK